MYHYQKSRFLIPASPGMGLFQAGVALLKHGMRSDMVALTDDRKDIAVLSVSAQFSER